MGYIVDYRAMNTLACSYSGTVGEWSGQVSAVLDRANDIGASTSISGNKANNMKQYLTTVYSSAAHSMLILMELFRQNYLLYKDDYYRQIDPAGDTHIELEEIADMCTTLLARRNVIMHIGTDAEAAAKTVSDLVSLPSLDIGEPYTKIGNIVTSLTDLSTAVCQLEQTHTANDFAEIDETISYLEAFIKEVAGQDRTFKVGFSQASFTALASVPGLVNSMQNAYARLSAQQADTAQAVERLEQWLEQERLEMEKREKQAKWAKAGVWLVTTIAVTAAVATGAGTLLVPVICGVASGAFNAAADQYVAHGWNTDQWDTAYIGKEAVKGWFTGFTSAILPPGTGTLAKAGVSSANSALWGGLDEAYNQLTTTGTISDTESIFFEAGKKGTSSFATTITGEFISDKIEKMPIGFGLDNYTNPTDDIRHYAGKFITGATDKVTSGIGERFVSTTVETGFDATRNVLHGESALEDIDLAERYSRVLSFDEIASDFVKGGIKEDIKSYITEHTPDPKTGLTPIIQSKLGYETDPETGLTGVVQDSLAHIVDDDQFSDILREMEERNPSTGANAVPAADDPAFSGEQMPANRTAGSYHAGDTSPDLSGREDGWSDRNSAEYDRMTAKLAEMDARGDDARNYEVFGDPRQFASQRQSAINEAWKQERELVMQGRGTRDWTVSQQEELIRTGKVSGFDGSHMLDASSNPSEAGNPDNIQFLTFEEHIYGAHGGDPHNPTTGRFDPATGETEPINPRQIPHREQTAFELSQKFDYTQADLAEQLGSSFGYGRGQKPEKDK